MSFVVPAPRATFDVPLDDGASICLRRHGNPDGVRLLITHGNGFAADAYFPFWQHLTASYDLIVFDFRNHGQNIPVEPSNHHYAQLTRDLEHVLNAVDARLGRKKTAGIFHSMSARTAMKHAVEIGWRWDALVLFDPPNVPPVSHPHRLFNVLRVTRTPDTFSPFHRAAPGTLGGLGLGSPSGVKVTCSPLIAVTTPLAQLVGIPCAFTKGGT